MNSPASLGDTVFTTGQVAEICKVAPRTVTKWFDSGKLKGYRVPGGRARRIPRGDLISFLKDNGMPLGGLQEGYWMQVLVITQDSVLSTSLKNKLANVQGLRTLFLSNVLTAGQKVERASLKCLVLDSAVWRIFPAQIGQRLQQQLEVPVLVLGTEDMQVQSSGLEVFARPFDPALLAERIKTICLNN